MTEVVWFRQQNNMNSFIVHFVCMNRHLKVVNHQVQVIEITNKVIMGIDKSSVKEKELVLELLYEKIYEMNMVCNILLTSGCEHLYYGGNPMKRISISILDQRMSYSIFSYSR